MSLATIQSRALLGVDALKVTVETHLSNGLPETGFREGKERVRSANINSGLEFSARRITVNLAPADLPKAGGRYDLALDGSIRAVQKRVCAILAAKKQANKIFLPATNREELDLVVYKHNYRRCQISKLLAR
jgi:magnesium chelatase family protein|tara:strand:- start:845 stop:1240 length:396 start_codon:yes stop_codon:yes gene_type:complete